MNLIQSPELLDRLAAAYALGTLRGGARRRFEQLAREHVHVRAAALLWQGRWSALSEVQQPVQPDSAVWTRINNQLQHEREQARQAAARMPNVSPTPLARMLAWWRSAAVAGVFATAAAVVVGVWLYEGQQATQQQLAAVQTQLQTAQAALQANPQINYVAVLADNKAGPAMLVTYDPARNRMDLQRVGNFREGDDKSLQLWALPPNGKPRSLGVLGRDTLQQLAANEDQVQAVPMLAISLEPKGGVPSETGPTGPVLFTGALIRRES